MASSLDKVNPNPLSAFTRLAPSIYCVEPRESVKNKSNAPTIIVSFWMNAPARAAVKYILKYVELIPSARIIFIFTSARDLYISRTSHQLQLKPAIDALIALASTNSTNQKHPQEDSSSMGSDQNSRSPVYIHLFSNGGLFAIAQLLQSYKKATGQPLRVSSMIIDSAPGKPTPALAIKALSYGLPNTMILRRLGYLLIFTTIWGSYVSKKIMGLVWSLFASVRSAKANDDDAIVFGDDSLAFSRKAVLDPETLAPEEATTEEIQMIYIYSDADELVPWKDVEEHAALASRNKRRVQLERFNGTPHVGHMRADPDRYWDIIQRNLRHTS